MYNNKSEYETSFDHSVTVYLVNLILLKKFN